MSVEYEPSTRPADAVGRVLYFIAGTFAVFGGLVLVAVAVLTTLSVTGRAVLATPVPGDFELVAIGTGIAVFAFLPWCQLTRGNVLVDFFMARTPARVRLTADIVGAALYLVIAALLTWRMVWGGVDMYNYNEVSMTINFPRWTTFPLSVALMGLLVIVIAYTLARSFAEMRAGRYFDE
jgi:TRAP-type C4-dicarboxylate transport system permease small subunit